MARTRTRTDECKGVYFPTMKRSPQKSLQSSYPCGRIRPLELSRRKILQDAACGFGAVALAALTGNRDISAAQPNGQTTSSEGLHHPARARHVIFLYMDGGPSQMDTFDPKPLLTELNGQPFTMKKEKTQFDNDGSVLGSPWKFNNYGESGLPISDLFPHVAQHADRLCVVRSMTSEFSEHTSANYFLHTGWGFAGRPSMGAWMTYGLGSECNELPGYVVLNGGLTPPGGLDNFASGFLPADFQASVFGTGATPIANLRELGSTSLAGRRDLLKDLDRAAADQLGAPDGIEAAIRN